MYFYNSFTHVILNILLWWLILFVFQRLSNRYPDPKPIKKDLAITFLQSVGLIILFPIIAYFLR